MKLQSSGSLSVRMMWRIIVPARSEHLLSSPIGVGVGVRLGVFVGVLVAVGGIFVGTAVWEGAIVFVAVNTTWAVSVGGVMTTAGRGASSPQAGITSAERTPSRLEITFARLILTFAACPLRIDL